MANKQDNEKHCNSVLLKDDFERISQQNTFVAFNVILQCIWGNSENRLSVKNILGVFKNTPSNLEDWKTTTI